MIDELAVRRAWRAVVLDCGCPDVYYCPLANEIECPRHGGFDVCCSEPEAHVPARKTGDKPNVDL